MIQPQTIKTPRLLLRKAEDGDLMSIWTNVWRDPDTAKTMLWRPTPTLSEAKARLERTKAYQRDNHAFFACLGDTGEAMGFGGVREYAPGAFDETGICVGARFRRMGYGREILEALMSLVFGELGGESFRYGCFRENAASAALCRSAGFVYSHSEKGVREWDGYEYLCDYYLLDREGYERRRISG